MSRIACMLLPDFVVGALCRANPDLSNVPLCLTEDQGERSLVIAASGSARALGVVPGRHTAAQARAITSRIVLRMRDPAAEDSAAKALMDVAASISDRIESQFDGAILLDVAGSGHLVASEQGLATALLARATRVGLSARVGLGGSMIVARLAALHGDGTEVVPAGTERGFLAPLPIASLHPPTDCALALERWGIRRLGELARLPLTEVATRLGAPGAALVRAARGEDERPLLPHSPEPEIEESIALDYEISSIDALLFVVRPLLERALARLGLSGIGAVRVTITLGLDDRRRDIRHLPLLAPSRDLKTMILLLRTEMESRPPDTAVVSLAVSLVRAAVRPTQLGLFAPAGPSPERLATTLARLAVLCGNSRVGTPVAVDSHVPGRAELRPFVPTSNTAPATSPTATEGRLMVRALRPPRSIDVFEERRIPTYVRGEGFGGRVVMAGGPWRLTAEWWTDAPLVREYYDIQLSDGGLYRCYLECGSGRWFVDGIYD